MTIDLSRKCRAAIDAQIKAAQSRISGLHSQNATAMSDAELGGVLMLAMPHLVDVGLESYAAAMIEAAKRLGGKGK